MRCLLPIVTAVLLYAPAYAHAHAILVESTPKVQSSVAPGPLRLLLKFNSRIDHARSRLVLRAGTTETPLTLDPGTPPHVLAGAVDLAPGAYSIRWQVLAIDGHITRGDVPFTVTGP